MKCAWIGAIVATFLPQLAAAQIAASPVAAPPPPPPPTDQSPQAVSGYQPKPASADSVNAMSGYSSNRKGFSARTTTGYGRTQITGYMSAAPKTPAKRDTTVGGTATDDDPLADPSNLHAQKPLPPPLTKVDASGVTWAYDPSNATWKNPMTGRIRYTTPQ